MFNVKRTDKIIILLTLLAILGCLLYLPWKAERKFAYGNATSYNIGYAFIGYAPSIYLEKDFNSNPFDGIEFAKESTQNNSSNKLGFEKWNRNTGGAFSDIARKDSEDKKVEIKAKGYEVYPDWVGKAMKVNYTQVILNMLTCLIVGCILLLVRNIFGSKLNKHINNG